jgi:hypothetical protein
VNANEILVEEPTDVSDERLVQEVTEATQEGHRASKTFSDAQEANAEGQEWRDRFRKVLPADTINPVGILVGRRAGGALRRYALGSGRPQPRHHVTRPTLSHRPAALAASALSER